jgi:hypothetical protein
MNLEFKQALGKISFQLINDIIKKNLSSDITIPKDRDVLLLDVMVTTTLCTPFVCILSLNSMLPIFFTVAVTKLRASRSQQNRTHLQHKQQSPGE